jgi:hypothetical protein
MQVNGDINFTGTLTLQGRDIKSVLDNHYELGLILVRGLIGGGYVGASVWSTLTLLSYSTDAWATSANSLTFSTNYGGWASAHTAGYVMQGSAATVNKIAFANETVTSTSARNNGSYSPSSFQHGVGYETTGAAFGTKAFIFAGGSGAYDKLSFSNDTMTNASGGPSTQHAIGWFDKEYGYWYNSPGNATYIYPFANETFSVLSTTNSPGGLGMPASQLEKGLNTKRGKAYVCGNNSWYNNTIFQFRNNIMTWTTNFGSQTQPNSEHAGTMGQNHGYLAGGYQAGGYNQNAHTDKVFHNTDTVVQIADAPRALSSASPMWSPI